MEITEICTYLRNYFPPVSKIYDRSYIHTGNFTIKNRLIFPVDFLKENQYFRITGSDMNDGIYCNNIESLAKLKDEDFSGCIWEMSVPPDFIELCSDIDEWRKKNETAESTNMSPFISESFGGYSYSKIVGNTGSAGGNTVSWQEQFRKRLNIWRKI